MDTDDFKIYTHYSELLEISKKTHQRDVLVLNQYLAEKMMKIQVKNSVGIKLLKGKNKDIDIFKRLVRYQEKALSINNGYRRLDDPRLVDICINLLLYHDDPIDIVSLLENYGINRKIISEDIKRLTSYFPKHNIILKNHIIV